MASRRPNKPVIPDLRFEQSYRRAIAPANGNWFWIVAITIRDQLFFPFAQGLLWALLVNGFRSWRTTAHTNGSYWGSTLLTRKTKRQY